MELGWSKAPTPGLADPRRPEEGRDLPVLGSTLRGRDGVLAALHVTQLALAGRPVWELGVDLVDGRMGETDHVVWDSSFEEIDDPVLADFLEHQLADLETLGNAGRYG